jgi:hypothetical protein
VRRVLAALAAAGATLLAAGCVSMPTGGPVLSNPITQATSAQNQPYVQVVPQPPVNGWTPQEIVKGFLTASASTADQSRVAREYLTAAASEAWNPQWTAVVYKEGPDVSDTAAPLAGSKGTVTVQVTGQEQASLTGHGSYSVPSSTSSAATSSRTQKEFQLVRVDGEWRISSAPDALLLTSDSFDNDYQPRNLYFLDPSKKYLVPDPVYAPVQAKPAELLTGLVDDLIAPPNDWLAGGATTTALPAGTKISGVTLTGVTAFVNLTGPVAKVRSNNPLLQQISAQLLWTLTTKGSTTGQPVQSVQLELNGTPWQPPNAQGNPVEQLQQSTVNPASGSSSLFYYVDSSGYLVSRKGPQGTPQRIERIGTGFSQVALSPDGTLVAALSDGTLYTGPVRGTLARRGGSYSSVSFDVNDDLWVAGANGVVMFRGTSSRRPLSQQIAVDVNDDGIDNASVPVVALRVAPDGVRVAVIAGTGSDNDLTFGAISGAQGPSPGIMLSQIQMTPQNAAAFTGVTWYGPDNVITLSPGPVATEYPVNGGTPTAISVDPAMKTISASWGSPLIAGLPPSGLGTAGSTLGSWTTLKGDGTAPTYPG